MNARDRLRLRAQFGDLTELQEGSLVKIGERGQWGIVYSRDGTEEDGLWGVIWGNGKGALRYGRRELVMYLQSCTLEVV